jgi:hypothetical protein
MELSRTIAADKDILESFGGFHDKELSFSIEKGILDIAVFNDRERTELVGRIKIFPPANTEIHFENYKYHFVGEGVLHGKKLCDNFDFAKDSPFELINVFVTSGTALIHGCCIEKHRYADDDIIIKVDFGKIEIYESEEGESD